MSLESDIEDAVCVWAENNGWLVRKLSYIGRRGAPDRLFVGFGQVVFMEFKRPGGWPDPVQAREHRRFRGCGVMVHVIDNVDEGIRILQEAIAR